MMIYNELPTVFPWYDKLEKQQRFRENARKACDYRLISPTNGLLPFQLKIDYTLSDNIFNPETDFIDNSVVNADDGTFDTLPVDTSQFVRTDFIPVNGINVIYFRRRQGFTRTAAFYDENYVFISGDYTGGVQGSVSVPSNAFFAVFNVSASATTRSYDKFVFSLTANEAPTQLTPGNVVNWTIKGCCDGDIDLTNNIPTQLITRLFADGVRVYYKGGELLVNSYGGQQKPLNLITGSYYSVIKFENGDEYFSEMFTIPEDKFKIGNPSRYMRIDFWNTCDIDPIMYSDPDGGWRQHAYIDSFIHASEPEVEEDGERDGNDMLIPTFQRMVVRYRFSAAVPDFVKIALVSMQIHDNIFVTTENDVRSGRVERMTTSATIDDNGAYSVLDVVLEQNVMVKKSCCSNMDAFVTQ